MHGTCESESWTLDATASPMAFRHGSVMPLPLSLLKYSLALGPPNHHAQGRCVNLSTPSAFKNIRAGDV